jgi:hypothetical protein
MFLFRISQLWIFCMMVGCAFAQTYPSKPIHIIATYSPGSSVDIIARLISKPLSEQLGVPVVVENKPGAGGDLATDYVAKAPKDGYTLGFASPAPLTVNPVLRKSMPFNVAKDIAPISLIATGPNLVLINPSLPVNNMTELVAYIRANPGKVSYASSGFGTSNHLAGELLKHLTKSDIVHVPYKGNSEAMTDLMGGRVQILFSGVPPVMPLIESGKMRAIAVADFKRSPLLPNVPTVAEAGLTGSESGAWYGLMAPAGTPNDVLNRIHSELMRVLERPEIRAQFAKMGIDPAPQTRSEFTRQIEAETAKWKLLFANSNIVLD